VNPFRAGFVFGVIAVVVALFTDLRFLLWDPASLPDWVLTSFETFRTELALAAYLFLGILAALRVRPTHLDPGVPYRSLLVRDGALAATIVAVMVGLALILITFLSATVFADDLRTYAREAAPHIYAYNEKVANRLSEPPRIPPASEFERQLQPPEPRRVGQSLANLVLRAVLLGAAGALVGALRGRRTPDVPQGGDGKGEPAVPPERRSETPGGSPRREP
jgi:hypothetical protein